MHIELKFLEFWTANLRLILVKKKAKIGIIPKRERGKFPNN
jgi:hypothetical protein